MEASRRDAAKRLLGPAWTTKLRCLIRGYTLPRWGNLRRTTPFSPYFGFERGTPVDRYYLHRFLDGNRHLVTGDVLEIQLSGHTYRYGTALGRVHSIDVNPATRPTFVCDLAHADDVIASDTYDCFLLPNTLNHLRDLDTCLKQALRVVKPGGTILASAASMVALDPNAADYWHLSADGWREVTAHVWGDCEVEVAAHGNCLAAIAAIMGLALEELKPEELDVNDPRFPVLVTIRCRKPR